MVKTHRSSIIALFCSLVTAACSVANSAAPQAAETIPLDLSGPRPTAQLRIHGGPPVTAIFDTGAAGSVLRLDYATRSALPNRGGANAHAPGGALIQGFQTRIDQGMLGDAHFADALAVALDLPLPLPGIDAVISPGVFAGRLVWFDFHADAAEILPKTAQNIPNGAADNYLDEDGPNQINRVPGIRVALPGRTPFMAMADTGAARAIALPLSMAPGLALAGPLAATDPVRMLGATRQAFHAQLLGEVRIGPLALANPDIVFVDGVERATIGIPVLRDTIIVLDPAEHRSWILPPATQAHR